MSTADMFLVWDVATQRTRQVTRQQMADGLMALAAAFGKDSTACAVVKRQALEVARGGTAGFTTVAVQEQPAAKRKGSVMNEDYGSGRPPSHEPQTGDLEKVAAQVADLAWSRLVNEAAARYAETTRDEDDTPERWRRFRTLIIQKLNVKLADEMGRLFAITQGTGRGGED